MRHGRDLERAVSVGQTALHRVTVLTIPTFAKKRFTSSGISITYDGTYGTSQPVFENKLTLIPPSARLINRILIILKNNQFDCVQLTTAIWLKLDPRPIVSA